MNTQSAIKTLKSKGYDVHPDGSEFEVLSYYDSFQFSEPELINFSLAAPDVTQQEYEDQDPGGCFGNYA